MMPADELHDRVTTIVARLFLIPRDDVTPELGYGVIAAWDSVGHLDLLLELEQAFGIKVTAELIPVLTTIASIESHLAATAEAP